MLTVSEKLPLAGSRYDTRAIVVAVRAVMFSCLVCIVEAEREKSGREGGNKSSSYTYQSHSNSRLRDGNPDAVC